MAVTLSYVFDKIAKTYLADAQTGYMAMRNILYARRELKLANDVHEVIKHRATISKTIRGWKELSEDARIDIDNLLKRMVDWYGDKSADAAKAPVETCKTCKTITLAFGNFTIQVTSNMEADVKVSVLE